MPRYLYRCLTCDVDFDDIKSVEEYDKPSPCPRCGMTQGVEKQAGIPIVRGKTKRRSGYMFNGKFIKDDPDLHRKVRQVYSGDDRDMQRGPDYKKA